jgi:hypothetical protein
MVYIRSREILSTMTRTWQLFMNDPPLRINRLVVGYVIIVNDYRMSRVSFYFIYFFLVFTAFFVL